MVGAVAGAGLHGRDLCLHQPGDRGAARRAGGGGAVLRGAARGRRRGAARGGRGDRGRAAAHRETSDPAGNIHDVTPTVETIGPAAARRAALAAQGFADPPPSGPATRRHLGRVLGRVRLLQLDSVNIAVRAHYMPVFSRLGPYDRALVDDAAWSHSARKPRLLVEAWAHEASLLPVEEWPLIRSGAGRDRWWVRYQPLVDRHPGLVDDLLA